MSLKKELQADSLLLGTAIIWGLAFVFQSTAMDHVGPITFVFGRFIIASLAIIPIWFLMEKPSKVLSYHSADKEAFKLGIIMSMGMLLQQTGLLYTTVGRAGFLTALYIVFVPLLGLFMGSKTQWPTWVGVALSFTGLYFLSNIKNHTFFVGDGLMLLSAVTWALHVIYTGRVANRISIFRLMFLQFAVASIISGLTMLVFEFWDWNAVKAASKSLLFVGIISSCIGFSLQVLGMRTAPASHTALILSFEAFFAALAGWWILDEHLTSTEMLGCGLILLAGLVSQIKLFIKPKSILSSPFVDE
jgi:drug/metabolite transporter (DMT)-like permease